MPQDERRAQAARPAAVVYGAVLRCGVALRVRSVRRPRRAVCPDARRVAARLASTAACDTKATEVSPTAPGIAPNMGRIFTGCGVGIEALGSPICAHAIVPPLITISGLA